MLLLSRSVRQEAGRMRRDRSHGLPLAGQAGQRPMKFDVAYLDDDVAKGPKFCADGHRICQSSTNQVTSSQIKSQFCQEDKIHGRGTLHMENEQKILEQRKKLGRQNLVEQSYKFPN